MSEWFDVATVNEFKPGDSKLVELDEVMVAVFNLEGDIYAIEDVCTHQDSPLLGCGLAPENIVKGDEIVCPRHGARFSIKTGEALSPPAYEATRTFPTRIENDMVQIRDDSWD